MENPRFKYIYMGQRSPEWQELHNYPLQPFVVSASVVPCVLGLKSPSVSRLWEYYHKVRPIDDISFLPIIQFGVEHEKDALDTFEASFPTFAGKAWRSPGPIVHVKYEWLHASLDAIYLEGDSMFNVEVKCKPSGLPARQEDILLKDIVQCIVQMEVSLLPWTVLIYWASPTEYRYWLLPRAPKIAAIILDLLVQFKKLMEKPDRVTKNPFTFLRKTMIESALIAYRDKEILKFDMDTYHQQTTPLSSQPVTTK